MDIKYHCCHYWHQLQLYAFPFAPRFWFLHSSWRGLFVSIHRSIDMSVLYQCSENCCTCFESLHGCCLWKDVHGGLIFYLYGDSGWSKRYKPRNHEHSLILIYCRSNVVYVVSTKRFFFLELILDDALHIRQTQRRMGSFSVWTTG